MMRRAKALVRSRKSIGEGGGRRTERGRRRTEKVLGVVFPDLIEEKTLKGGGWKREDGRERAERMIRVERFIASLSDRPIT
jgi:hypothetical protein